MEVWPSGSRIVLESQTPTGVKLLTIGYKYNATKVLHRVATKDAGSTGDGAPYVRFVIHMATPRHGMCGDLMSYIKILSEVKRH